MKNRELPRVVLYILMVYILSFNSIIAKGGNSILELENQGSHYSYKVLKKGRSITKQLTQDNTVYEIRTTFDLSTKCDSVKCNRIAKYFNTNSYCSDSSIHLKKGETILALNSVAIVDENQNELSKGYYTASSSENVFLIVKEKGTYKYSFVTPITLPQGCVLLFKGGSINNGVIHMSGGYIDSSPLKVFNNCIVDNVGNGVVDGRWFFYDGQEFISNIVEGLSPKQIDFNGLSLYSKSGISIESANWKGLSLLAPYVSIGHEHPLKHVEPIYRTHEKDEYESLHVVNVSPSLEDYKGKIITISFGEHVRYDWREENDLPTLFRGLSSVINDADTNSITIDDYIDIFDSEYTYNSSNNKVSRIYSKAYIYEPCQIKLENCRFISSKRTNTGFMYIYSAKDFYIHSCTWEGQSHGTHSLLGINSSVGGTIDNCFFVDAFYPGTETSYGLQLFNSTRVFTSNCTFKNNRRGYDVSGNLCQTRYSVLENCKVIGVPLMIEGSSIGGHSTSYGNIFRNNIIEGSSATIGIQTRGEREIIEGNTFYSAFRAAAITCVDNTIIRNNVCYDVASPSFVWIESSSLEDNTIIVENNFFTGTHLVRGQNKLSCNVIIRGNVFRYLSPKSSLTPMGDSVTISCYNNKLIKGKEIADLYYKLNTTVSSNPPIGKGLKDVVDLKVLANGSVVIDQ